MQKISILKEKETVRHNLVLDVDVVFYIFKTKDQRNPIRF